jgi:hypothetical protein
MNHLLKRSEAKGWSGGVKDTVVGIEEHISVDVHLAGTSALQATEACGPCCILATTLEEKILRWGIITSVIRGAKVQILAREFCIACRPN